MPTQRRIEDLQEEVKKWADEVFPHRTPEHALQKLVMEEIPELLKDGLDDPLEWGDLIILIIDAAGLRGIDVVEAGFDKMEINRNRTWEIDKKTGLMNHVKR